MKRSQAIEIILRLIEDEDLLLTTTGMISRETYTQGDRDGNLYMVGSMGLLSSIGLGIALNAPSRRVIVVEGDGSALMSLGTLPLIAYEAPGNFHHVVLDNEAYESTGNQPTITCKIDLGGIAGAAGYRRVGSVRDDASFKDALETHLAEDGPSFLLAKVTGRAAHGIPRVGLAPRDMRDRFRRAVTNHRAG